MRQLGHARRTQLRMAPTSTAFLTIELLFGALPTSWKIGSLSHDDYNGACPTTWFCRFQRMRNNTFIGSRWTSAGDVDMSVCL